MTQANPPRPQSLRQNDVFISYSRKDKAFVQRLDEAFRKTDRDPWIDWEDIHHGEEWRRAIARGIETADTFIFVISPDSVASAECRKEIDQAISLNKRLIPVVRRDAQGVHPVLAELNWIFFRENDSFDQAFQKLIKTINTDLQHVQCHTRYLSRAIEWENGRDDGFLLRGKDLDAAEQWLAQSNGKKPVPAELQRKYIAKSREVEAANDRLAEVGRQANRKIRISSFISIVSLVSAGVVIAIALYQVHQRIQQLNAEINAKQVEVQTLTIRQAQLTQDRTVLIRTLQQRGFTDEAIEDLLARPPEEWLPKIEQSAQADASYRQTLDQLEQEQSPESPAPDPADPSPSPDAVIQRETPVTIEYYPKDIDPKTVRDAFTKLGFNLDIKKPEVTDVPINVIFYGENVEQEDVKLVAYALIRAGAEIKYIQPFRGDYAKRKPSIIQVGAERKFQDKPPLEVEQIRNQSLPLPR
ncbi:MAG: TIR domain-containing protein [Plectolyngbya sp. WJT66-NPBG17]|jgi:hypothetical protein|nr:TIR domain-containing protein [Plectolyngbya sp. WJT66-NPBG17]